MIKSFQIALSFTAWFTKYYILSCVWLWFIGQAQMFTLKKQIYHFCSIWLLRIYAYTALWLQGITGTTNSEVYLQESTSLMRDSPVLQFDTDVHLFCTKHKQHITLPYGNWITWSETFITMLAVHFTNTQGNLQFDGHLHSHLPLHLHVFHCYGYYTNIPWYEICIHIMATAEIGWIN